MAVEHVQISDIKYMQIGKDSFTHLLCRPFSLLMKQSWC